MPRFDRLPLPLSVLALCLAAALPVAASAQAADPAGTAQAAQQVQAQVVAWRRDIHQHPELGQHEVRTAKLIADQLRKLGLQPRTGIAHTGVTAVLKGGKPGPRIAIRADMDALPVTEPAGLAFASKVSADYRGQPVGVMHACGHDAHVAILLGVATALAAQKDQLPGEVMFVFQPAEEGPPTAGEPFGAKLMLDEGVFKDFKPEAVFGLHVWAGLNVGQVGYRSGPMLASADEWSLTVRGKQTHGSRPWDGVDPITVGAQILLASQSLIARQVNIAATPVVLTAGQFNSGVRFNIIPDEARLVGTLRTFDAGVREDVIARLRRTADDYAHAAGATAELQVVNNAPATVNDPALTRRVLPSLQRAAGESNVAESGLVTVAEDFSQFANTVPGFYFFVGSTAKGTDAAKAPINHSPNFMLDEGALEVGTRSMLQVALDYLHGP
ncbi:MULTISPECIES: amidohydrolase [unclassified Lysobacter]|uniref:amidohydrolase n=1 Tax=unclassified Lysobacter TaxID=2635362 RepID=UPI001BEB40A7|nr:MULTISPECIES: amidohydrolase [unclassified Lysobacter]MBT2750129.1 amidohydrolase [Lysobacter sp. ISL-50]MBT2775299.1 amidohydrolase [Lysobacter sp. ISL-54]MBT2782673.1 amidohydrolase [Lysobacter sp. ISL-52]